MILFVRRDILKIYEDDIDYVYLLFSLLFLLQLLRKKNSFFMLCAHSRNKLFQQCSIDLLVALLLLLLFVVLLLSSYNIIIWLFLL